MLDQHYSRFPFAINIFVFSGICAASAIAEEKGLSDFKDETETWKTWCEAQIDQKNGPVTFHKHTSTDNDFVDKFIAITAIEESLGGNKYDGSKCKDFAELARSPDEGDGADDLGPPVFEMTREAMMLRKLAPTVKTEYQKKALSRHSVGSSQPQQESLLHFGENKICAIKGGYWRRKSGPRQSSLYAETRGAAPPE